MDNKSCLWPTTSSGGSCTEAKTINSSPFTPGAPGSNTDAKTGFSSLFTPATTACHAGSRTETATGTTSSTFRFSFTAPNAHSGSNTESKTGSSSLFSTAVPGIRLREPENKTAGSQSNAALKSPKGQPLTETKFLEKDSTTESKLREGGLFSGFNIATLNSLLDVQTQQREPRFEIPHAGFGFHPFQNASTGTGTWPTVQRPVGFRWSDSHPFQPTSASTQQRPRPIQDRDYWRPPPKLLVKSPEELRMEHYQGTSKGFSSGIKLSQVDQIQQHTDDQMPTKILDLEKLKKTVTEDSILSQRCFIIKETSSIFGMKISSRCSFCPVDLLEEPLLIVFGEDNIEGIEILSKDLVLVTVVDSDKLNSMLASVGRIKTCWHAHLDVVPVRPLPARVKVVVSGIPRLLTSAAKSEFLSSVAEVLPMLSDLSMVDVVSVGKLWSGVEVEGVVKDLVEAREQLSQHTAVTFRNFSGVVVFTGVKSVEDCDFKPGENGSVKTLGWEKLHHYTQGLSQELFGWGTQG